MKKRQVLQALVARQVRRMPLPLERRHRGTLRRAGQREGAVRTAAAAWWRGEPRWFAGGTPPRAHNQVQLLIDGASFFGALQEALAGARDYVYVVGWCLTPAMPLDRRGHDAMLQSRLGDLLRATARRAPVRVLLWDGAVALFPPTRGRMEAVRQELETEGGANMQCRLDTTAPLTHCHHQKAIVIDGQVAFVGGMDLTTLEGDRWDTPGHPLRVGPNWHDVQVRIVGDAVADVEHNFRQRWHAVTGTEDLPHRAPAVEPGWHTPVQIVRTIPRHIYASVPHGEFGIHHAYLAILRRARRLIYLENQYLWSSDVLAALITAMNAPREEPLRIVLVMPARAERGKWANDRCVSRLRAADGGRGIVSVYALYTSGPTAGAHPFTYRPIYVHSKIAIVDDEWLMVGSANMNDRGFVTDSELNVLIHDTDLARDLRLDLWAEHLALPRAEVAQQEPIHLVDHVWGERARDTVQRVTSGDRPLRSAAHRYEVGHMPGSWLLEEMEMLAFDQ